MSLGNAMNKPIAVLAIASLSAPALAQVAGAPGAAPSDFLQATNDTQATVRVEYLRASAPGARDAYRQASACLGPKESVYWPLASPVGKVRLQVMRGNECGDAQPVACEHAIDRVPGLQYVSLRGEGRQCGIFPMPAPASGGLKAARDELCGASGTWVPLTFTNRDPKRAMWVTVYNVNTGLAPNSKAMWGCWLPGERRMACVNPTRVILQAEMTGRTDAGAPAPNCNASVTCKTTMDTSLKRKNHMPPNGATVDLYPNGRNCYWDHVKQ
jgi:hypothetical protein